MIAAAGDDAGLSDISPVLGSPGADIVDSHTQMSSSGCHAPISILGDTWLMVARLVEPCATFGQQSLLVALTAILDDTRRQLLLWLLPFLASPRAEDSPRSPFQPSLLVDFDRVGDSFLPLLAVSMILGDSCFVPLLAPSNKQDKYPLLADLLALPLAPSQ